MAANNSPMAHLTRQCNFKTTRSNKNMAVVPRILCKTHKSHQYGSSKTTLLNNRWCSAVHLPLMGRLSECRCSSKCSNSNSSSCTCRIKWGSSNKNISEVLTNRCLRILSQWINNLSTQVSFNQVFSSSNKSSQLSNWSQPSLRPMRNLSSQATYTEMSLRLRLQTKIMRHLWMRLTV